MIKKQSLWILIIIGIGFVVGVISYLESSGFCSVRQLDLVYEMKKYSDTNDAQLCDTLNTKISKFNDDCKSNIEELDCG
ncbi:MAG: hypothetical protein KGH76_05560 [Thaumarchaeota archaeon]|nr:hypothetical protein [Nitrososphaerota archaeon]MDE1843620.1 hypothetical protein [Nitrososphaerota archaeon]